MIEDPEQLWVGRGAELEAFEARLEGEELVCVVGPPGVGKSAFVRRALTSGGHDSVTVGLTEVADSHSFHRALAEASGADAPSNEAICEALAADGPSFVVLDDFDRLAADSAALLEPLLGVPGAPRVIVTSRERLPLTPRPFSLGPLDLADAVDLFEAAARRVNPEFQIGETGALVEELVVRLDRLPLAIELATARLRTFSPADVLERLDRRFALLRGRAGQRSLEDAVRRSWELLDPHERECLRQCAVFRGGFDLDAVEAIVDLGADAPWALDVVERLVDKSLISRADSGSAGRGRLGMYESIRDFVGERGALSDELQARHAEYFVELGEEWLSESWTGARLERAAAESDNLVAVIERYDTSAPDRTCLAARALDAVLRHRPAADVHELVLQRGVAAARTAGDDATLAELLRARAELGVVTGELERAADDAAEASALANDGDQRVTLIRAEVLRSEVERRTGHAREALSRLQSLDEVLDGAGGGLRRYVLAHRAACHAELGQLNEARDLAMHLPPPEADGDAATEYSALKRLAYAHYYLGNYEHQHRLNRDALELAERVGDRRRGARARQGLGDAAFARGDYHSVREHYAAALDVHRELGNEHLAGVLLGNLGSAEHRIGEFDDAARHYEESLAIHQRTGARPYEAVVTFALAVLEHERGHLDDASFRYERAAELFGDLEQSDDVVATQVCRSWLAIARDDYETAENTLDWAEFSAPEVWQPVLEGTRRLLASRRGEAVEPLEVDEADESLPALLAAGLAALVSDDDGDVEFDGRLTTTLQGRLLLRFAEPDATTTVPRRVQPASTQRLFVGEGGEWFRLPGEEKVNLRRRRAHRLILDRLTTLYESDPGEPLDVYEAFDVGWPGESATAETAAERVYWVVGTLRKLGLDGLLLTSDAGYYLDPGAEVTREETG